MKARAGPYGSYDNMDYDKVNGYLVQFPDDVDWIKTLNSKDVRIIK